MGLHDLDAARIAALLKTNRFGRSLTSTEQTGSTNDDARALAARGAADGHVVVADAQTHGRGSHGRTWLSPPGLDLYLSVIAHVQVPLSQLPPLTLAVGLAVADTCTELTTKRALVKWPNDVWIDGRKAAGTLVESSSTAGKAQPVVIGIGLNVNRVVFPDDLDTPATSLALSTGAAFERASVLAALLGNLERWVDRFARDGAEPITTAVNERLALKGELCVCEGVVGVVNAVEPSGALLLRDGQDAHQVVSGTLRRAQ